ncbi:MAG: zinc metallopeptidase [Pseudomonadota bacterium]
MNPVFVLIPAAALMIAPRLWVSRVLKQHNRKDEDGATTASEVARELLDRHGLQAIRVELTDLGDHYDPNQGAVRLARDKYDRRTLTAITTAAHEVSHALQHASGYPPFQWRARLARLAQITGEVGTVLLLSVPAAALISRQPLPPRIIGTAALGMLGTGVAAQLAALPTEFDASFNRALPMLRDGLIEDDKIEDARRILFACSLTYVTSSLAGVLNIWPWLGRGRVFLIGEAGPAQPQHSPDRETGESPAAAVPVRDTGNRRSLRGGIFEAVFRQVAKPLIRSWLEFSDARINPQR